jgi:hypothetical protein
VRGQLLLGTANKRRSVRLRKSRQDGIEIGKTVALTYWLTRSMASERDEVWDRGYRKEQMVMGRRRN